MTDKWQNRIDRVHKVSEWCIGGIVLLFFISAFFKPGNWSLWTIGILFVIALLVNIISGHWATDEEKKEYKQVVKEALREVKEEDSKSRRKIVIQTKAHSPLKGLTPEQTYVVLELLNTIPEESGHIKTSLLVQFLRALKGQGDLDDQDKENLIAWVQNETGKKVDERNFKYDYDNKFSENGVTKWGNIIRAEFDKL